LYWNNLKKFTMSLSFVSKTVQTCTEDGNFEERAIENKESSMGINRGGDGGTHKPLFEQLRANQEQEEAERLEYQQSIMRGTLALDEEDCAHLDAVQKQRQEHQTAVQRQTQEELQAFRAAQADRLEQKSITTVETSSLVKNEVDDEKASQPLLAVRKPAAPPLIVAKKRLRVPKEDKSVQEDADSKSRKIEANSTLPQQSATTSSEKNDDALGSLMTGYGSSSDED
jgi:hypothetical protein